MIDCSDSLVPSLVDADDLSREFATQLAESSTLAVRVAYSVVRHRQDAEDIAQDAFVRAWRKYADLRNRDAFRAWLVRMTWRLALDWKRGVRRRVAHEDEAATQASLTMPFGNAETDAIASDRAARLWSAIDTLPEKLRLVIVLAAIDGHGMKDVAALLGVPQGTVKSRLFDARRTLEAKLR